jgi:hypothetical protein
MRTVFHLCGEGVLEDDRYKTFMSEFGPDVHVSRFYPTFLPAMVMRAVPSISSPLANTMQTQSHSRVLPSIPSGSISLTQTFFLFRHITSIR